MTIRRRTCCMSATWSSPHQEGVGLTSASRSRPAAIIWTGSGFTVEMVIPSDSRNW